MSSDALLDLGVLQPSAAEVVAAAGIRELVPGRVNPIPVDPPKGLRSVPLTELDAIIARRRSTRRFAPDHVQAEQLATVCEAAHEGVTLLGQDAVEVETAIRWVVFARRVTGLPSGIHEYHQGGFSPLAELPDDAVLATGVQTDFVSAPAILLPVWRLGRMPAAGAVDGYLNTLVMTGSGLHVAWLTAVSLGLSGGLFRGVHPALLHKACGLGRADSWPFLALALGRSE